MKTQPTPIFFSRKSRLGLSGTIVALILVIIGVSLALLVGSIVGGQLGGWARKEGIVIEDVTAALVGSLESPRVCVTVQVKNTGGSQVTSLQASTAPVNVPLTFTATLVNPGSSSSASGCTGPLPQGSVGRGDMLTISVTGTIVGGGSTSHQRSVPIV